jgi:PilZ domain-containing protein
MTQDRRNHDRTAINLRARWEGISGQQECRIGDLAMGGCFVDSMSRVEIGELVSLEIELPSGEWLPLQGEVTTCQEGIGFGLQFTTLTKAKESALRELVK